jgi:hypothetical protein
MGKRYRCRKCRRDITRFRGIGHVSEVVDLTRSGPDFWRDGDDFSPLYVLAVCECGHSWRLRGVTQISDLTD